MPYQPYKCYHNFADGPFLGASQPPTTGDYTEPPQQMVYSDSFGLTIDVDSNEGEPIDFGNVTDSAKMYVTYLNVQGASLVQLAKTTPTDDDGDGSYERLAFTVPADTIPSDYAGSQDALMVIQVDDGSSQQRTLLWRVQLLYETGDGSGTTPDADDMDYSPTTAGDWIDPDPTTVEEALDQLAGNRLRRRAVQLSAPAQTVSDATGLQLKRWTAGSAGTVTVYHGGFCDTTGAVPSGAVVRLVNHTAGSNTTLIDADQESGDPLATVSISSGDDVEIQVYNGSGASADLSADITYEVL